MFFLSLYIGLFNIVGYTLFSKAFDTTNNWNIYITYIFLAIQILLNIFYILTLIACYYERKTVSKTS